MSDTDTGAGTGKEAGKTDAGTVKPDEGGSNTTDHGNDDQGASVRLTQKVKALERENNKLKTQIDTDADAKKTEQEKAIDNAKSDAETAAQARIDSLGLSFKVQRALLAKGVNEDGLEDIAMVVQKNYPDLDAESIPAAVTETMKRMGLSERAAVSPGTGGSPTGTGGAGSDNPWTKSGWNISKQWQIENAKGESEAKRLAALAGSSLGGAPPS